MDHADPPTTGPYTTTLPPVCSWEREHYICLFPLSTGFFLFFPLFHGGFWISLPFCHNLIGCMQYE